MTDALAALAFFALWIFAVYAIGWMIETLITDD